MTKWDAMDAAMQYAHRNQPAGMRRVESDTNDAVRGAVSKAADVTVDYEVCVANWVDVYGGLAMRGLVR